jgi:predicted MFS family arabinose efflux permease
MGVGGIIGALLAPRVVTAIGLGRTLTLGMTIAGVLLLAFMFTSYGWLALALNVGWMLGVSLINVPLATIRQNYAKEANLGRVISVSRAVGWATLPIGALVGGWLADTEQTLIVVARTFPILLVLTALWLVTTIVWSDTFGPNFEGRHTEGRANKPPKPEPTRQ